MILHAVESSDSPLQKLAVQDDCQPSPLALQVLSSCTWLANQQPGTAKLLQMPLGLSTQLQCQGQQLASVLDCKSLHCAVKA